MSAENLKSALRSPAFFIGCAFMAFQVWILFDAQQPMLQRPAHVVFALVLLFLYRPLSADWMPRSVRIAIDALLIAAAETPGVDGSFPPTPSPAGSATAGFFTFWRQKAHELLTNPTGDALPITQASPRRPPPSFCTPSAREWDAAHPREP